MPELETAVQEAVVRIGAFADGYDGENDGPRADFWGSGFFIAPGWVLTNAHVVDAGREPVWRGERVIGITTESGEQLSGELACALPAFPGSGRRPRSWPDPDLALVRVPDAPDINPLWLSERSAHGSRPVHTYGYAVAAEGAEPQFQRTAGRASAAVSGPMTLQDVFNPSGCSGGPVVDAERGAVVGVNKASRDGGRVARAAPVTALRGFLDLGPHEAELWHEVVSAHDRHHFQRSLGENGSWPGLQYQLDLEQDLAGIRLGFDPHERARLFGCFAELPPPESAGEVLGLVEETRNIVLEDSFRLHVHHPRSWREGVGLLYDLSGGEPGRKREGEAVVLYAALVYRALGGRGVPDERLADLKDWVRSGKRSLRNVLKTRVEHILTSAPAVSGVSTSYADVLVEIDPDLYGSHPWRIKLVQADGQTAVVKANETGVARTQLEGDIRAALAEALGKGDVGEHLAAVDFVLPRTMFDEPVEKWRAQVPRPNEPFSLNTLPLGHRRTVALRDHHRWRNTSERIPEWHQRWRAVRKGQMAAVPLCPARDQQETQEATWSRLNGAPLNSVPVHCARAASGRGEPALGVALGTGYPVILWRRCDEQQHDDCAEFQTDATELLRRAEPDGVSGNLRDLIRDQRGRSGTEDICLCGDLVLLYDPPQGVQRPSEPLRDPPLRQ